ncbi:SHOCT domain-containing protein [Halobacteria archaeon AArc-dxtr1]|nr:SHOCT domain-containing protein [Halobacteria archaeon AArc-dxtr1]
MSRETAFTRLRENLPTVVGLVFMAILVVGLFTGPWVLLIGVVGLFVLTPTVALLFGDRKDIEEWWGEETAEQYGQASDDDPVETLKRRYAEGELTEEAFEYKLQQILDSDRSASLNRDTNRSTASNGSQTENAPDVELEDR